MQTLGWTTVGMTYFLMVWGNGVGSTGASLACPDWPLCHGSIFPSTQFDGMIEWGHRMLALATSIFIILTLHKVFTAHRTTPSLRRSGKVLLVLVGIQVLLGGVGIFLGKSALASTAHLMIATLVFGGLINVACVLTWPSPIIENPNPKVKRLATWGLIAVLIQFCIGAAVRHTQSGLACPNFPFCMESFFPLPFTFGSAIAFLHRWWGVLMLGVFIHLALTAAKTTPSLAGPTRRAFALSVAQTFLGIGAVMSGLSTQSRVIHAAVGYAICGLLFYVTLRSGGLRWFWERSEKLP